MIGGHCYGINEKQSEKNDDLLSQIHNLFKQRLKIQT